MDPPVRFFAFGRVGVLLRAGLRIPTKSTHVVDRSDRARARRGGRKFALSQAKALANDYERFEALVGGEGEAAGGGGEGDGMSEEVVALVEPADTGRMAVVEPGGLALPRLNRRRGAGGGGEVSRVLRGPDFDRRTQAYALGRSPWRARNPRGGGLMYEHLSNRPPGALCLTVGRS